MKMFRTVAAFCALLSLVPTVALADECGWIGPAGADAYCCWYPEDGNTIFYCDDNSFYCTAGFEYDRELGVYVPVECKT